MSSIGDFGLKVDLGCTAASARSASTCLTRTAPSALVNLIKAALPAAAMD
ncbi:MAG: hypothetical protein ABJM43_02795 [Paracoccaceae bacterium]